MEILNGVLEFGNHSFRKYSPLLANPADRKANLTLSPTTLHFDMVRAGDDYRLKEWRTIEISVGYQQSARHPDTIANSKSFFILLVCIS
jgi:hypothetical protein